MAPYDLATILQIYQGSNGDATKALYAELEKLGPAGVIAVNLFRACKTSERAKVYRGRRYRDASYDTKAWAMGNLCRALTAEAEGLGISWGWGVDKPMQDRGDPHHHVLYVEISTGQVSFHTAHRLDGPDYPGSWDGARHQSAGRICQWVSRVFTLESSP